MRSTIPWVALVLVAIFAFMQLDAAQRARGKLVKATDEVRASEAARVVNQTELPEATVVVTSRREAALDRQLAEEQAANRDAEARIAALEAQLAAERERADRNEALRATEKARADALEKHRAEVAANLARTKALLEKGASLVEGEPVKRWLEDALSDDEARVAYARARAAEATPEQVEALRGLLRDAEPGHLAPAARLAGVLPPGPATRRLVSDLVLRLSGALAGRALDRIGPERLLQVDVLERVLSEGSPRLQHELVVRARGATWSEPDRARLAAALLRLLETEDATRIGVGCRGMALLRLAGGGERLVALTAHDKAAVRAGAAHALSRVPDLPSVADGARARVAALLSDENVFVRTAAVMLAEALLGSPVVFDPAATPEERAQAIARIKARFGS